MCYRQYPSREDSNSAILKFVHGRKSTAPDPDFRREEEWKPIR
jgi:hypothetical protein